MTTFTWRCATSSDIGRLARFFGHPLDYVKYGRLESIRDDGYFGCDLGENRTIKSYARCEVQDIDIKPEAIQPSRYSIDEKFEVTMILLYDWAMIWHRQAGGYTASDTAILLMRAENYINEMIDRNHEMECFRPKKNSQ